MKFLGKHTAISVLLAVSVVSGCSTAYADSEKAVSFDIKDGYYLSEADDSYFCISDGYIDLVNFDISSILRQRYDEGVENGIIDPKKCSFNTFYENSVEGFGDTQHSAYTLMVFGDSAMLVTEKNETGNGGGSYSGYTVLDDRTLLYEGSRYVYGGIEKPAEK